MAGILSLLIFFFQIKAEFSFIEDFQTRRFDFWRVGNFLRCLDSRQCVLLNGANIKQEVWYPQARALMQFEFLNNCYDRKYCCQGKTCTDFTGAQLTTTKLFGYGSFRWRAYALLHLSEKLEEANQVDVSSCFTLESDPKDEVQISTCISSMEPSVAVTYLRAGKYASTEYHKLPFDARKELATYRIDYHGCYVKWIVNGEELRQVKADTVDIPYTKLRIGMGIFPTHDQNYKPITTLTRKEVRPRIEFWLRIFRVRFEEFPMADLQFDDELMVLRKTNVSIQLVALVFLFTCIILAFFLYLLFERCKPFFDINDGHYYRLFQDSNVS